MQSIRTILVILLLVLPGAPANASQHPPLDVMLGQMLLVGFRGTQVSDSHHIIRDIQQYHLGGVILFDRDMLRPGELRNIKSPKQLDNLTRTLGRAASIPLFISVDQEGGLVNRLKKKAGFWAAPSPWKMGAVNDLNYTRAMGVRTGRQLARHGINMNFAPVVDVRIDPKSPAIGALGRSFSANPKLVAKQAEAFIQGQRTANVISCLKHFPGHGSAGKDSHHGLVDVTKTWSEKELVPYRYLINSGQAEMVMTAHLVNRKLDQEFPATLSHKVITGVLRDQLNFTGVVVSDDMNMGAIVKEFSLEEAVVGAVEAGADILLFGNNLVHDPEIVPKAIAILKRGIKNDRISSKRIRQSYTRIMQLKRKLDQTRTKRN